MKPFANLKSLIAQNTYPLARLYIRYWPFSIGKLFIFELFRWREFTYTVRTRFGALMTGRSNDLVQGYIYYFGTWEPDLSAFISLRLREQPHRTFVDVGANVGYFTLLAAHFLKDGSVVAIEAFPNIFKKLEANVLLNNVNNVRLVSCAVTDIERDIQMFYAGSGNEGATTSVVGKFKSEPVVVRGKPLSNVLTDQEIRSIKLIKIDVEGAEYFVVRGMRQIIQHLPDDAEIIIEITPSAYPEGRMEEMFSIFQSAGFFPYELENSCEPDYCIQLPQPGHPSRLHSLPINQTDVIFSKVSANYL